MISDSAVNRKLFSFYLRHAKPQYETWSSKRIVSLKVGLPIQTEDFLNIQFKGFRGANHELYEFILADFPFMNPYDWLYLFHIVTKDVQKYEPIVEHLKRMIKCYILEIAKMDVEIASVLKKRPILKPEEEPKDIQQLKAWIIWMKHWSIFCKRKEGDEIQNCMFTLVFYGCSTNNPFFGRSKQSKLRCRHQMGFQYDSLVVIYPSLTYEDYGKYF